MIALPAGFGAHVANIGIKDDTADLVARAAVAEQEAQGFVAEHPWAADVGVVINLEARGTTGQSLMFETSVDNAWLIDAYASAVRRPNWQSIMSMKRALPLMVISRSPRPRLRRSRTSTARVS